MIQDNVIPVHRTPEENRYTDIIELRPGDTLSVGTAGRQKIDIAISHASGLIATSFDIHAGARSRSCAFA